MLTYCGCALGGIVLGLVILVLGAAICSECCDHDWVGVPT